MNTPFTTPRFLDLAKSGMHLLRAVLILSLFLGFILPQPVKAQDTENREVAERKEALGKLSSRSPISAPTYIGITLIDANGNVTSKDMFFSADKDLKISHKKEFSDIQIGDTVRVVYDEISEITDDNEKNLKKRVAKIIKFVKSGKDNKDMLKSY